MRKGAGGSTDAFAHKSIICHRYLPSLRKVYESALILSASRKNKPRKMESSSPLLSQIYRFPGHIFAVVYQVKVGFSIRKFVE